ncbi:MAG: outer membrane protein assembly factor BamA [Desulfarculaceae bacterium]|jgi:outer membrane protein insertion porin family
MSKKLMLLVMALFFLTPAAVGAAGPVQVAVFPFDVFSREPLTNLRLELQEMLKTRLEREGLKVLDPTQVNQALKETGKPLDLSLARSLANQLKADYAVYGSLTVIGSRVSLDLKVLDALGMSRPQSIFVEGAGLTSLPPLADKLASEVASRVSGREQVADIQVKGNRRIEAEAIKAVLATKAGGPFSSIRLDEDLRAVWKMGYFDDVRVQTADSPQGKIITFLVKEKPTVREIQFVGNKAFESKDLRDQTGLKTFGVFQPSVIKEAETKIVKLYHDKGYYDVKVASEVMDLPSGDKGVKFTIQEGDKVFIESIRFSGNKSFEADELRDVMSTKEEGWLSWLTDDNILDRSKLEQDREKINDFYYNHGYLNARVGEPQITRGKGGLIITFPVVEGERYKVSALSVTGELLLPQPEMMKLLKTKVNDWFNRKQVRDDLTTLHDLYADRGFAYVEVRPQVRENTADKSVSIVFDINKGQKVYFERIIITGNTNTRDNVIRRVLSVTEGSLFNSAALRRSNARLYSLGYFEDVHISTSRGSTPDKMDLKINVKEKRTGSFSVGGGYSTEDLVMAMGSISESNLFGMGYRLQLRGTFGAKASRYTLSFTDPWLFDMPISAGFDLYNWKREYTSYDRDSTGGNLRFGFPLPLPYFRLSTQYKYEQTKVSNVSDSASLIIRDQVGTHTTSSIKATIRRDSRNHIWNPTRGSDNSLSAEYAGDPLGGDNTFIKVIADTGWYVPLWFEHVLVLHARMGWLTDHSNGNLPIYEKFFLGGIHTLRGFDRWSVGPKDPATGDVIGGERMAMANIEYRFPLLMKLGLVGVVFYDTGNAWSSADGYDISDLRESVGCGLRWYSPVGPLRLEYGHVLDPQPGESEQNWEFTIGGTF